MDRLTKRSYWTSVHQHTLLRGLRPARSVWNPVRRLLGDRLVDWIQYNRHVYLRFLSEYLADMAGKSILEVGCAPGVTLVTLASELGLVPYGIDYSEAGAARTREVFETVGFDPANVIQGDFFCDTLLTEHKERYDVVYSQGFIEHFDKPADVVARHLVLLKPGGLLVVVIPNLLGANLVMRRLFTPQDLPLHNLELMRLPAFQACFRACDVCELYCGYLCRFAMSLSGGMTRTRKALFAPFKIAQIPLNVLCHLFFGVRPPKRSTFANNLAYVGRKPAATTG
ncbi:MAG: class I SAM-dependent methyltransferase [Phycisphaerae bacterium]|nr:class I SAM-dependent methyltransferase [Phycisphaerae bacterium]